MIVRVMKPRFGTGHTLRLTSQASRQIIPLGGLAGSVLFYLLMVVDRAIGLRFSFILVILDRLSQRGPAMHVASRFPWRAGFTLVELLVVIAIIGMITAISVPTIFGAIASARNAKTKAEIDMLHIALMTYKNEYGSVPPANMGPVVISGQTILLWNAAATPPQVDTRHPVYKHLARIFPRLKEYTQDTVVNGTTYDSPYKYLGQLSPAQALVFWLQGFYDNPEQPLSNGYTPGNRKKLFDFNQSRLYAASSYLFDGTPQVFSAPMGATPFPVYFTGHPTSGLPYVYFDSRCYSTNPDYDINYAATNTDGTTSIASPYINSLPPVNGTWGQQHMAPDTFQIIATGKDGLYGAPSKNQAAFPKATSYSLPWQNKTYNYWSTTDAIGGQGHKDNLTNFADRPLGNAVESLQ